MQHAKWIALAAVTLAVGGVEQAGAQQAPAGRAAVSTPAAPRSTFGDIRSPLSAGFNPALNSPFFPDIRQPLSGVFAPGPFIGNVRQPFGSVFTPNPFVPDFRQPLTGMFNPAAGVPFNGVFGTATSVPPGVFPTVNGFPVDISTVNGFPTNTGLANTPFFVTPSGGIVNSWGEAVQPVYVPVYVPVPVTQGGSAAVSRTTRQRLSDRPGTARARRFSAATRERLSVEAAERLMASTPLTEGIVVSENAQGVRVRIGGQIRRFSRSQVFYFTGGGQLRNGAVEPAGLARGGRVLVPIAVPAAARTR